MTKVMVTITSPDEPPTLESVIDKYRLGADDIDTEFGLVEVDPTDGLYVILVEPDVAVRIDSTADWDTAGPYSNPRIAPFGPPESDPGASTETAGPDHAASPTDGPTDQAE